VVLATLAVRSRDSAAAVGHLEAAFDREQPNPDVLELLAKLKLATEKHGEAAELYELGREKFPYDLKWLKGQAAAYLKLDDTPRLKQALEELSQRDADNFGVRKKLAEIALEEKDYPAAVQYGLLALHVDVTDAEIHGLLGAAYVETKDAKRAVREYEVALQLKPGDEELARGLERARALDGERE
jgi:cytochrome c-type biogenesis protein CcmH/NrfG